jgi:crotonobetainyl-CoA:carnitine CoA-transferase CaiB-like acyl-CoA transferase
MSTTHGPMHGIRIIDLSTIISGPIATQILGDQGADVIKVEPPGIGDLTRRMGTQRNGLSAIFATANRNKRGIILDLKSEAGVEILGQIVATADVVVQNFRPGAVERMGIGYDKMRAIKPDIIYASITGFGTSGPYSSRRVYDPLIQAASGIACAQGQGGDGRPQLVRSIVCDKVTSLTACQAITAALFARERGAGGQHLQLSMLDSSIAFHWSDMMWNHSFVEESSNAYGEITRTADLADLYHIYDTVDGTVAIIVGSNVEFHGLCRAFGCHHMIDDPRYTTLPDRIAHIEELIEWQEQELAKRTTDEACAILDEHGVPCSRINAIAELGDDPQIRHNGSICHIDHPVGGAMRMARHPTHFGKTPAAMLHPAPGHGEHTIEVLREIGLDDQRIENLEQANVLGAAG